MQLTGEAEAARTRAIGLAEAKATEALGLARATGFEAQKEALGGSATAWSPSPTPWPTVTSRWCPRCSSPAGAFEGLAATFMRSLTNGNGKGAKATDDAPTADTRATEPTAAAEIVGAEISDAIGTGLPDVPPER
ncbi:MAG: hypothetical protein U0W40_15695 [Acidimicrobiia bacterium]